MSKVLFVKKKTKKQKKPQLDITDNISNVAWITSIKPKSRGSLVVN